MKFHKYSILDSIVCVRILPSDLGVGYTGGRERREEGMHTCLSSIVQNY